MNEELLTRGNGLALSKKSKNVLTKEQQAFNKITKRIHLLQQQMESESKKMDSLKSFYQKEVLPAVQKLSRNKIILSQRLHEKRTAVKLSNAQNTKLDRIIFLLLEDAFSVCEPDEATKKIYDFYCDTPYDEGLNEEEEEIKSMASKMFKEQFGVDLDPSVFEENPDFDKLKNDLEKQFEEKESKTKPRKKTTKQIEQELLQKQKDELKGKSLRSIYLSLVKILHPDTEKDEKLRGEKEETMKEVTVAYQNKDMMSLLKIQTKWVTTHEGILNNTDENTLKVYTQLLKDQAKELAQELEMIYWRYDPFLVKYSDYSLSAAKSDLTQTAYGFQLSNQEIEQISTLIEQSAYPSQAIKRCIDIFHQEDDFFDFDI